MTRQKVILLAALLFSCYFHAISQTNPPLRIEEMPDLEALELYVRDSLFGGGATISNIEFSGNLDGIGTFSSGGDLNIMTGLMLSNGYVKTAVEVDNGQNKNGAQGNPERDSLGRYPDLSDADMEWLRGYIEGGGKPDTMLDATVITFKFKPWYNTLKLRYVFASEEYLYDEGPGGGGRAIDLDLTGEPVADLMAIMVKKTPSQRDENMLVSIIGSELGPGFPTKLPVCVTFVNHNRHNLYYRSNHNLSFIYDGLTEPLDIDCQRVHAGMPDTILIKPCQTYWVKIAVADFPTEATLPGFPGSLRHQANSSLFLESGSLISGDGLMWDVTGQNDNNNFDPMDIVEGGCSNMVITLSKNRPILDTLWMRFKITGASPGEYTITPEPKQDSLIGIPPGYDEYSYVITAVDDGVPEGGVEEWLFRYQADPCDIPSTGGIGGGNAGYTGQIPINVHDYSPLVSQSKTYGPSPASLYFCGNEVTVSVTDIAGGGIPPYSYVWSHPATGTIGLGDDFTFTLSGSPDVAIATVKDRCSEKPGYSPATDSVYVYSTLTATASPDFQLCENLDWPISITGTNVGDDYSVQWKFQGNTVGTSSTYLVEWDTYGGYYGVLDSLVFQYVVTDDCGNTNVGEVVAFWDPVVQIDGPPVICLGEPVTLQCTDGSDIKWYNNSVDPSNLIPGETQPVYTFTPATPGIKTICVQIINACDEPASTCFTFEVSEMVCDVEMVGAPALEICPLTPFELQELNGFSDWNWSWFDAGQTHTATGQTISLSLEDAGDHTLTVSAYNEHGCYDERDFTLTVYPYTQLQATSDLDSVCAGFPVQLGTQSAVATTSYLWTAVPDDPSLAGQQDIRNPVVNPAVTTTYTCEVTDANGCSDTGTKEVTVRPEITGAVLFDPAVICTGEPVSLVFEGTQQPGASYFWTFDGGTPATSTDANPTVVWDQPGNKNIHVDIDEIGCSRSFDRQILVNQRPQPQFTLAGADGCSPLEVQFTNESTDLVSPTFEWDFGDGGTGQGSAPSHTYEQAGLYDVTLTVTNSTGCAETVTYPDAVEVYPTPGAEFAAQPLAATIDNPRITFTEQITGDFVYIEWDFGDGTVSYDYNPDHVYSAAGFYDVIMYTRNQEGCEDSDTLLISITEELKVYIPTAFTPNGDGLNDCFAIKGTTNDIIDNFNIIVFSRWGNLVYKSRITTPDCVWDGNDMNGEPVPHDTYVYRISGTDYRGTKHNLEGMVTVLR